MRPQVLATGNGGWVRYEDEVLDPCVFVRFEDRSGRLSPVEVFIRSERGIDTDLLRHVPLGLIESWVNESKVAIGLRKGLTLPGPDLLRAASYFESSPGRRNHWVARMLRAQLPESKEQQAPLLPLETFRPESSDREEDVDWNVAAKLSVPTGVRDYGDSFYRSVALVYERLLRHRKAPAPVLADVNSVPMSSAHRWIREARRRGFLPPGRQGKAG